MRAKEERDRERRGCCCCNDDRLTRSALPAGHVRRKFGSRLASEPELAAEGKFFSLYQ